MVQHRSRYPTGQGRCAHAHEGQEWKALRAAIWLAPGGLDSAWSGVGACTAHPTNGWELLSSILVCERSMSHGCLFNLLS